MASRKDFAQKTTRSGGASRSRSSAPKPAPRRRKSTWPLALVSIAAIGGLAYGLMQLNDFQSAPVQQQTTPVHVFWAP